MLRIQLLFCCIAFVSASRLLRRELEDGEATGTVCINWFGNNLDWENTPFKSIATMSPWGFTPGLCTEEIVQGYGEYHCATYDSSSSEIKACNGDCFNGVCVDGYATPEPTVVCSVGEEQNGIDCWPCTPGTFNANVGGVCSACPQGTYASEFGSATCSLCEIGFVAPNEASPECEACPEGYTTEGLGQTECVPEATPEPTLEPTLEPAENWAVLYYQTKLTCLNGGQKISQPCNGGRGTGCSYDACMQHCFDQDECNFFFHITSRSGCILYRSCELTRTPAFSGTTVQVTRD